MKPQERVAVLSAIKSAVGEQVDIAKADTMALAKEVGVKTFTTPFGQVTISSPSAGMVFEPKAFMAWVKKNHPTEIETIKRVRPAFESAMRERVEVQGSDFIDKKTGEVLGFITGTPPGNPSVLWPSTTEQKAAKELASVWAREHVEALGIAMTGRGILMENPDVAVQAQIDATVEAMET